MEDAPLDGVRLGGDETPMLGGIPAGYDDPAADPAEAPE